MSCWSTRTPRDGSGENSVKDTGAARYTDSSVGNGSRLYPEFFQRLRVSRHYQRLYSPKSSVPMLYFVRFTYRIRVATHHTTEQREQAMKLHWEDDEATAYWAQRWILPVRLAIQSQYDGSNLRLTEGTWLKHVREPRFPAYCFEETHSYLLPSPTNIILCFQHERYLEALALVVAWGGMTRAKSKIYGHPNDSIEQALRSCMLMTQRHMIGQSHHTLSL